MHDTLSNRSHIQYEPFSENQRAELLKNLKSFLDGQEDEIEVASCWVSIVKSIIISNNSRLSV